MTLKHLVFDCNGVLAEKTAGMCCIVTTNGYTENEDFTEADLVVTELGDKPNIKVTLMPIFARIVNCSSGRHWQNHGCQDRDNDTGETDDSQ